MSVKSESMHIRLEPALKKKATKVFGKLGLTPSDAVRIFFMQSVAFQGMPFPLKVPNKESVEAIEESKHPENLKSYFSVEDMFKGLGMSAKKAQ